MPIRPENRARYPRDWTKISERIRFVRAGGKCECTGQCGDTHVAGRCAAPHGVVVLRDEDQPQLWSAHSPCGACVGGDPDHRPVQIVLTVAHLDHTPEHCADDNLLAMCQRCHNRYDGDHRRRNRSATRARKLAGSAGSLFE